MTKSNKIPTKDIHKVYICGKMSGLPEYNYPRFNQVASELRLKGYFVENPAEVQVENAVWHKEWEWHDYMKAAIQQLIRCDAIYVLNGYETSKGANIEIQLAKDLGINVYYESKGII